MPTGASGVAGALVHKQLLRLAMLDAYYAVVNESPAFAASLTELRDALADGALESGAGLVDDPDAADTPADAAVAQWLQGFAAGRSPEIRARVTRGGRSSRRSDSGTRRGSPSR